MEYYYLLPVPVITYRYSFAHFDVIVCQQQYIEMHRAASRNSIVAAVTTVTACLGNSNITSQNSPLTRAEGRHEWKKLWGTGATDCNNTGEANAMVGHQVLARQLWHPSLPYPLWDYNWDGKMTSTTTLEALSKVDQEPVIGTTRHVILIRHGQYDESSKVSAEQVFRKERLD